MASSRSADTAEHFEALEIMRYHALGMELRDGETFTLGLSDYPGVDPDVPRRHSRDYNLTFNMIIGGSIAVQGQSLGLIDRWTAHLESPLIDEAAHLAAHTAEAFVHFEVVGHTGRLDVVARDFSFAMVRVSRVVTDSDASPSTSPESGD